MTSSTRQEEIANWFDKTYSRRGEWYLRPVRAYYIFLELLKVQPKERLLDIACGLGRLLEAANEYDCKLTGIDISKVAIEKAQQKLPNARIQWANAEELPFDDDEFDIITCLGSLERMLNLSRVLQEIKRVTTADARFCFLVRNENTATWNAKKKLGIQNEASHQGAKNLQAWTTIFENEGFEIIDILPDQYPLQKRLLFKSLGIKKVDYRSIVKSNQPIEKANEFIFILRKTVPTTSAVEGLRG